MQQRKPVDVVIAGGGWSAAQTTGRPVKGWEEEKD